MMKKLAMGVASLLLIYLLWPEAADTSKFAFKTADGLHVFNLRVAATDAQRMKGLMFVKSMPENEGMIFVNPQPQVSSFWMKNTYIPLDIIFLDELYRIFHIHEATKPLDESIISSPGVAKYIIELNGGLCKKLGIMPGHVLFAHN